jgi:predicted dehydrogenase
LDQSARRVRLGVIGCGSIAEKSHLPGIERTSSVELAAVADLDESKSRTIASILALPTPMPITATS